MDVPALYRRDTSTKLHNKSALPIRVKFVEQLLQCLRNFRGLPDSWDSP